MISILAVLSRTIVTPFGGGQQYIAQETEVIRFPDETTVAAAFDAALASYPNALSFEIYRPRTDSNKVERV